MFSADKSGAEYGCTGLFFVQIVRPENADDKRYFFMIIINVNIYTSDKNNSVIRNGYIKTENGKITETGEGAPAVEYDGDVFDGKGRDLYPGFIDAHTHLGMFEDSLCFEGDDGNESTEPVTPQLRAIDGANPLDGYFSEAVRAGVTSVMICPGSANPVAGQTAAIKTCGKRIDDMVIKAPAAIKFSLGENPKSVYNEKERMPVTRMGIASVIREALKKAQKYREDQQKFSENPESCEPPEYDEGLKVLSALFDGTVTAHFHAHRADDIFTALRICREFDISCVIVHGTEAHLVCDELKKDKRCTGVLSGPFLTDRSKPELKSLTPASPGILSENGVPTAIITDHPETPIEYLTLCAAVAVREGMDRTAALRAITITAAEMCGIGDRVGSIEKGKDADFVIYGGDPLDITNKPEAVFVDGKF